MGQYYAIRSGGTDDKNSLKHWKYIKREKVNGKWRHYYDDSELRKYAKGAVEQNRTEKNNRLGKHVTTNETKYQQSDNLFDDERTISSSSSIIVDGDIISYKDSNVTKTQGKISRAVAKGEKKVYDLLYNPVAKSKRKRDIKASIDKAKSWFTNLFK